MFEKQTQMFSFAVRVKIMLVRGGSLIADFEFISFSDLSFSLFVEGCVIHSCFHSI